MRGTVSDMSRRISALFGVGVALVSPGLAYAQDVPESLYAAQDELGGKEAAEVFSLPDAERYRAIGVRAGTVFFYPEVEVAGLANSNMLGRRGGDGDVGLRIAPRVRFQNDNPDSALNGFLQASVARYADFKSENVEELAAGISYRRSIGSTSSVKIHAEGGSFVEDRAASFTPTGLLKPTEYDRGTAGISLALGMGRVSIAPWVDVDKLDYRANRSAALPVALIDQNVRDQTIYRGGVTAGFAVSPATFVYGGTELNRRNYDVDFPIDRDSKGYAIFGGVRIQPSRLTRFDAAIGYQKQSYRGGFTDPKGLYLNAKFDWKPTPLLLLSVDARRDISETGGLLLGGSLRNRVRAKASYELLRNLRVDAGLQYRVISTKVLVRNDRRGTAEFGVRYLASPSLEIIGGSDILVSRSAISSANNFGRVRAYAGIRLKI